MLQHTHGSTFLSFPHKPAKGIKKKTTEDENLKWGWVISWSIILIGNSHPITWNSRTIFVLKWGNKSKCLWCLKNGRILLYCSDLFQNCISITCDDYNKYCFVSGFLVFRIGSWTFTETLYVRNGSNLKSVTNLLKKIMLQRLLEMIHPIFINIKIKRRGSSGMRYRPPKDRIKWYLNFRTDSQALALNVPLFSPSHQDSIFFSKANLFSTNTTSKEVANWEMS